ncbi:hypothetical protein [Enterococcus sp. DIV0756]|uniref:DUF2922 family protein n=1 Tax=Enterococcus sp. DIV0756 TaxID=2774636 RepID=UPI003F28D1C3
MNIKPLNQRQLFTTLRKNLEKKVSVYFDETKDTSVVIEYIIAILVRNALTIKDFSLVCEDLVRTIYLNTTPNNTLRQFFPYFRPYFDDQEWQSLIKRLFTKTNQYHRLNQASAQTCDYLHADTITEEEAAEENYTLVSVFRTSNGKKHTWNLRDVDITRTQEEIRALLKLLNTLTIFQIDGVRKFTKLVKFDIFETKALMHFEEPEDDDEGEATDQEEALKETKTLSLVESAKQQQESAQNTLTGLPGLDFENSDSVEKSPKTIMSTKEKINTTTVSNQEPKNANIQPSAVVSTVQETIITKQPKSDAINSQQSPHKNPSRQTFEKLKHLLKW